ncbi:hypothetical protein FB567DRAFT_69298 [Paraphoma chrysanthemicola]|uniref:Uncharacterized protein n=1 Tax=Paraphoma chrysanthemicola TaxID=798071 RepID=A0A8K0R3K7_9PLEO|nr:hypothetical protein FB567DRAFT_69298 [Paraphoma chrysanthemicola]
MATYDPYSRSPRLHAHDVAPVTPVHSPHHSVTSSISTRTPVHTLSIHEYRKQQNTSTSQKGTPAGKTLRRRPAAQVLNGIDRPLALPRAAHSSAQLPPRPLQSSQSAHQLSSQRPPFHYHLLSDQAFRSQSAEPRAQGGSISSISTITSTGKVRHFNTRKRLPKPPTVTNFLPLPSNIATAKARTSSHPQFPPTIDLSTETLLLSDAQTARTASTFSLSRFPQPPHWAEASPSPAQTDNDPLRIKSRSFAAAAPATPPATPATIHYRGTSFDLVNPHDSLLFHDIVTPSKEFGSSEFLIAHISEDPLATSAEMAPKRALYGDLNAAHAGIMRRADDSFSTSNLDLPLPPTPAAVSPTSSSYTSPLYSPESNFAPSPLSVKKSTADSRFSLKQLTRTLTKRLVRDTEPQHEEELQELSDVDAPQAWEWRENLNAQTSKEVQIAPPGSVYLPVSPASPVTPTTPMSPQDRSFERGAYDEIELPRKYPLHRCGSAPLASLIPDDPSTQVGRVDNTHVSVSEGFLDSRPYYDDLDSIYPSSSIYTSDARRTSNYQQSLASARQSNPFSRYSAIDSSSFANSYHNQDSLYELNGPVNRKSTHFSGDTTERSGNRDKMDTISKIIDQYDPAVGNSSTMSAHSGDVPDLYRLSASRTKTGGFLPSEHSRSFEATTDLGEFEFDLRHDTNKAQNDEAFAHDLSVKRRKSKITGGASMPPSAPPPLAPAFEYCDVPFAIPRPETSEMFSNRSSSYGDTRNLLQLPQGNTSIPLITGQGLPSSSSYSQPDGNLLRPTSSYSPVPDSPSVHTPQEALDEAEEIFNGATEGQQHSEKDIPAMWARRSSGSLLFNKKAASQSGMHRQASDTLDRERRAAGGGNEADWESIGGLSHGVRDSLNSHAVRDSFDSVADYSSSEGTRNSLGLNTNGSMPSWTGHNHSQEPSIYSHPSPLLAHRNPFSSSPPQLRSPARLRTAPSSAIPPLGIAPRESATLPTFGLINHPDDALGRGAVEQPFALAPWADPYAFSDKETLELLASGPNDKIMFDEKHEQLEHPRGRASQGHGDQAVPITGSPATALNDTNVLERENTFEKLSIVGPKGNLTGTPRGTGMHETGSSVANTSSPGLMLTSSIARGSIRSNDYLGFYASPYPATSSVTRIHQSPAPPEQEYDRTPSQVTLFPKSADLETAVETSPTHGPSRRPSLRCSTNVQRSQRRMSRTAVPGQTKLREMILSPEAARKTLSSADTSFSRFIGGSERPSMSDTITPLRPNLSVGTIPAARTLIAHQYSPHLLCPERAANPEDEERRRKLSWAILAVFCLLPPCIILFRVWGDTIMISLTKGRLGHCTDKSKKVALIAGISVNIGVAVAIVVPIVIAHALGAA